jgi:hypothetical protein
MTGLVTPGQDVLQAISERGWLASLDQDLGGAIRRTPDGSVVGELTSARWGGATTLVQARLECVCGADYFILAHTGWPSLPLAIAEEERRQFVGRWQSAARALGIT